MRLEARAPLDQSLGRHSAKGATLPRLAVTGDVPAHAMVLMMYYLAINSLSFVAEYADQSK